MGTPRSPETVGIPKALPIIFFFSETERPTSSSLFTPPATKAIGFLVADLSNFSCPLVKGENAPIKTDASKSSMPVLSVSSFKEKSSPLSKSLNLLPNLSLSKASETRLLEFAPFVEPGFLPNPVLEVPATISLSLMPLIFSISPAEPRRPVICFAAPKTSLFSGLSKPEVTNALRITKSSLAGLN